MLEELDPFPWSGHPPAPRPPAPRPLSVARIWPSPEPRPPPVPQKTRALRWCVPCYFLDWPDPFLSVSQLLCLYLHPDHPLFVLGLHWCQGQLWSVLIHSRPLHHQKLEWLVDFLHWPWPIPSLPQIFWGHCFIWFWTILYFLLFLGICIL